LDVDEDDEGKAKGIHGFGWETLLSKQLQTICSRLSIKGVKNVKKGEMIDKLIQQYSNQKAYGMLQASNKKQDKGLWKQVQCSFRLMNILFSDQFASSFASLGNIAT